MALGTTYLYNPTMRMMDVAETAIPLYHANVALARGWVTTADLQALAELANARFATPFQFRHLCYPLDSDGQLARVRRIQERLQKLQDFGLVNQIVWVVPGEPPRTHYAYCITLNAAMMLRDWQGAPIDWKPGMGNRQLKPILRLLAANEFRVQVVKESRNLITDWRMLRKPDGPVASFKLGGQPFLLDCPRDDEDAFVIRAERYTAFMNNENPDNDPLLLLITPHERAATELFERLKETIPPDRILFSTDARAFEGRLNVPGYLWIWDQNGKVEGLSLLDPAESA